MSPQGKSKTQGEIEQSLREILSFDVPMALYQLPQVTQNEMEPETVQRLALDHANFLLFKDTSGEDRVASSGLDFGGVSFLRGSELGGYARWLRSAGGGYDGFLLSSANVFAKPLMQVIEQVDQGRFDEAEAHSKRIEEMVGGAFAKVASHSKGNPFTNANKAMLYWKNGGFNAKSPLLCSSMGSDCRLNCSTTCVKYCLKIYLKQTARTISDPPVRSFGSKLNCTFVSDFEAIQKHGSVNAWRASSLQSDRFSEVGSSHSFHFCSRLAWPVRTL